MTSATAHPLAALPEQERRQENRILSVIRLQFINTQTFVWVPALVLAGAIVCSLLIYAILPTDEVVTGGGAQAPMWYFFAVGIQALTLSFPFSQAMSVTRREFYIGTLAAASIGAAALALVLIGLAAIERATNGYGGLGYVAYLDWAFVNGWASAWLTFFTMTMLGFVLGFWFATIYKRWGTLLLTATILVIALALIGAIFFITRLELWGTVGTWFVTTGPTMLTIYGLGLVAVLAVGSYLTLRRTTV